MNLLRWVAALAVFVVGCSGSDPVSAPAGSTETATADAGSGDFVTPTTDEAGGGGSGGTDGGAPASTHAIGGSVTGLVGTGLVLVNGGETSSIPANAKTFAFPTRLASGASFAVDVQTQPSSPTQTCVVTGGTGTVAAGDVSSIAVDCTTSSFTVGGTVTGLTGAGLVLTNNGGDDEAITADGKFEFAAKIASGQPYLVAVKTQPTNATQHCVVAKGSGTIGDKAILHVEITCARAFYVDAVNGNDATGDGSPSKPLKTVTNAISAAVPSDVPTDIVLAPGTYDAASGEEFPIMPRSHQTIYGEVGAIIAGSGTAPSFTGGDMQPEVLLDFAMYFKAGIVDAAVRGVKIDAAGDYGIGFDDANVILDHVIVDDADEVGAVVAHGSNVRFLDCEILSGRHEALLVVDLATKVRARRTSFASTTSHAIALGYTSAFTGSNVDLGNATVPGNNTLLGGKSGLGLYLRQSASGSVVQSVGNTWRPNVQGSDAAGKYPASFVDGSSTVAKVNANNYAIDVASAGSGIQF